MKSFRNLFLIAAISLSPAALAQTVAVQSFTLINADTNQPVAGFSPISSGSTINLATLPSRRVNIQVNTSPAIVGSVRIVYGSTTRVEGVAPYAVAGDSDGNYWAWTPPVGPLAITATAFTGANASGTASAPLTITVNFVDVTPTTSYSATIQNGSGSGRYTVGSVVNIAASAAPIGKQFDRWTGDTAVLSSATAPSTGFAMPARDVVLTATYKDVAPTATTSVTSLVLINADNGQPISGFNPILNGTTLNLATLPTRNLNVRADTNPSTVGSVKFVYTGGSRVESVAPYAMLGDTNGVYARWTPPTGTLTITATPYSASGAAGTAGTAQMVSLSVIDSSTGGPIVPPPPPPPPPSTSMPEERNGFVEVEAEAFVSQEKTDNRRWYITSASQTPTVTPDGDPNHASTASGKAYIEILPDTRRTHSDPLITGVNYSNTPGQVAIVKYSIKFNTPGRYYVWARIFSTGSEDNGVHVGLNGTWPSSGARMQWCNGKNSWYWDSRQRTEANHCGEFGRIWLDIPSAGTHTVMFSMREDGFEMDKFLLTTNPNLPRPQ